MSVQEVIELQTKWFIDYRPDDIVFTRHAKVADGSGGFTRNATGVSQSVHLRMIQADPVTVQDISHSLSDGRQVTPNWLIVCENGSDILPWDTATIRGHKVEVIYLSDIPTDRIVAMAWEEV